jgi:hypothetical protein
MWNCPDNQEVGLEAAILQRKRNSSLVEWVCAENSTGLSMPPKPRISEDRVQMTGDRKSISTFGSSDEMRVWLRYSLDLEYISEEQWQRWRDEYQEISRMLQGLHRSWR